MLSWVCEFRFQGLPTCVARFANLCCNAMDGRRRVSRPVALRAGRLTRPKRGLGQRAQRAVQFGPTLRASSREVMGVPVPRCTHAQGYRYFCFLSLLSHNGRIATGRAVGYAQREDDVPVALKRPRQSCRRDRSRCGDGGHARGGHTMATGVSVQHHHASVRPTLGRKGCNHVVHSGTRVDCGSQCG